MGSTYLVTPDFRLEMNQWMRRVGWGWTLLLNAVGVLTVPLIAGPSTCVCFATFSALLAWRNLLLLPPARSLAAEGYSAMLLNYHVKVSNTEYYIATLSKAFVCLLIGFLLLATTVPQFNASLWFIGGIARAFMFMGAFFLYNDILSRLKYRGVIRKQAVMC